MNNYNNIIIKGKKEKRKDNKRNQKYSLKSS